MMSKMTAVARSPSGNTMSIGCTGCPANLTLLSIMVFLSPGLWSRLATELLLHLLKTAQVTLHCSQRLLQVCLDLLVLHRRHDLGLDLVDVRLMIVYFMLDERLVEVAPGFTLQVGWHGNTVRRGDAPALSRRQSDVELLRQGLYLLAVLRVIGRELLGNLLDRSRAGLPGCQRGNLDFRRVRYVHLGEDSLRCHYGVPADGGGGVARHRHGVVAAHAARCAVGHAGVATSTVIPRRARQQQAECCSREPKSLHGTSVVNT